MCQNDLARALKAEADIDRLRADRDALQKLNESLYTEIKRLRAETAAKTEALNSILAEHSKVSPELERLRAENELINAAFDTERLENETIRSERDCLRAEVAELREALNYVVANGSKLFSQENSVVKVDAILAKTQKATDEPPATDPGSQTPE